MFSDKTKVEDKVSVAIHTMTPDEKARVGTPEELERRRRIRNVPATWYCVAANPEEAAQEFWTDYMRPGIHIKVVFANTDFSVLTFVIGRIEDKPQTITVDPQTILVDQEIKDILTPGMKLDLNDSNIVQVFTDSKDVADVIQKERKTRNGNG